MVDEVWRLLRDRVGDRELEGAQEYLTGSFPLTIETPSQIALQVLNAVFFGLDMNELQTYRERVSAVTVEDVQRVARNYLHPDRLTIVLVGDASAFTKQLPGVGFDKFDVIPAADLDLSAADLRRKPANRPGGHLQPVSYTVPMIGTAQRGDDAKALLNKAIAAKGGLAKLQGIKTVKAEGTMSVATAGKPATFKYVQYVQYPDRFRTDGEMPGGQLTQVFADGKFWIRDANGAKELDAQSSEPVRAIAARDMVRLLVRAAAGELAVRSVDTDTEDPLVAAIEISGPGVSPVTLIVNRDNGLIEQMRYVTALEGRCVETYSDYRNVSGIQVPFHTVQRRGPMSPVERDVRTIHFNVPLDAALFVKPS
jgi:outer membrane lipoprotein-sorting protein